MAKKRIAINGFGRIGRLATRALFQENTDLEIVAINDLSPADNLAYLFKYDSTHKIFPGKVTSNDQQLIINDQVIQIFSEKDPAKLPWKKLGVDYVIESTGLFTDTEGAKKHLEAGAKRVLISAPAKGNDIPTFVMGVNHEHYQHKKDFIFSNASCTTNCLGPLAKVVHDNFAIKEALMTTVHAVTATQPTVDGASKKDWRGGRAAGVNIIPASTGAAKALTLCMPELKGKITGMSFRVPVVNVSVVDLTVKLEKQTSYAEICNAIKEAADHQLKGILQFCDEPLVSSDFIGNTHSSIFDLDAGIELNPTFYKLVAWYDNEYGYSNRVIDFLQYIAQND